MGLWKICGVSMNQRLSLSTSDWVKSDGSLRLSVSVTRRARAAAVWVLAAAMVAAMSF